MPTVATASAITFQLQSLVTVATAPAATTATANQVLNPLEGFFRSDPIELPGDPVTASVVRWAATVPATTTLTVETSLNNGASWDVASSDRAIPRLRPGDTTTRQVLVRVTLTRTSAGGPKPVIHHLEVRVTCDSGVYEWVPIAYGVLDKSTARASASVSGGGGGGGPGVTARGGGQFGAGPSVKVRGVDMFQQVKLAQWEQPFFVAAGTNYADAVRQMLLDRLPGHDRFSMVSTTRVTPSILVFGLDQGGDSSQDIQEVAGAIGFECFFDPDNVFVFRPVPDPRTAEPVEVVDTGVRSTVTDAKSELDLETVVNYVVIKGESTSSQNAVTAFAFDDDPQSLSNIHRIGKRVRRYTFPQVDDESQVQAIANAVLYNSLGGSNTVTLHLLPNPAREPGDAIKVKVDQVGVDGIYVINSIDNPSPLGPQQVVCFRQTDSPGAA